MLGRITKDEDGMFTVHYKSKDKEESSVRVGKVMFGTGRKPNTRGIGLEVRVSCAACVHLRAARSLRLGLLCAHRPTALLWRSCP